MSLPNSRELTKLVKSCRKLGIKSFKTPDYEFTLTDYNPNKRNRVSTKKVNQSSLVNEVIASDSLTENELLFWSAGMDSEKSENQEGAA